MKQDMIVYTTYTKHDNLWIKNFHEKKISRLKEFVNSANKSLQIYWKWCIALKILHESAALVRSSSLHRTFIIKVKGYFLMLS